MLIVVDDRADLPRLLQRITPVRVIEERYVVARGEVDLTGLAARSLPYTWPLAGRELRAAPHIVEVCGQRIGEGLTIMAGPCAIESEEQIGDAASGTQSAGATFLRGGAYKPRTSPYAFQGHGQVGLGWLKEAGAQNGLPVVSEVMTVAALRSAAAYLDIIQVGARGMQNTALLTALGSIGKPVLLKRGFGNTTGELLHAAEYILAHGNDDVILCERGIRTFADHTRFTLDVAAVPWLKKRSRLPVIVDPSHAAGKREFVLPLAFAGVAAGADGLLVEAHPRPATSWSDADQALDFASLRTLVDTAHAIHSALKSAQPLLRKVAV